MSTFLPDLSRVCLDWQAALLASRSDCVQFSGVEFVDFAAVTGGSILSKTRGLFLFDSYTKKTTTNVLPIQCTTCSAHVCFIELHVTKTPTSPCHNVCSQTDGSHSTEVREKPIQMRLRHVGRQIVHHQLRHEIVHIIPVAARPKLIYFGYFSESSKKTSC